MLTNLSHQITSKQEVRMLGTTGLGVPGNVIDTSLENERDINEAAFRVLKRWYDNQEDNVNAYEQLCAILKKIGKCSYINYLTEY